MIQTVQQVRAVLADWCERSMELWSYSFSISVASIPPLSFSLPPHLLSSPLQRGLTQEDKEKQTTSTSQSPGTPLYIYQGQGGHMSSYYGDGCLGSDVNCDPLSEMICSGMLYVANS